MVSEKAKEYLRERFGEHNYDYEMSDFNLKSLIETDKPKNFKELDKLARELEWMIADIKRRQAEMKA